jgi:hypothetical protein
MHRLLIVALATSTTACLFPSLDGLSGSDASTDASADANASDAGDAGDASANDASDASDGGVPPATDDFEQGCGFWDGVNATVASSSIAHGGTGSCLICCSGTGSYCTFDRGFDSIVPTVVVGKTYSASAWIRVAPQTSNASLTTGVIEREIAGSAYTSSSLYVVQPASQAWTLYSNQLTITNPGDGLNLYIALDNYAAGDCFLVDDVSVTVSP